MYYRDNCQHMRQSDVCPHCEDSCGRVDFDPDSQALRYWHTDLPHKSEYCAEYPGGSTESISDNMQPTGKRATL